MFPDTEVPGARPAASLYAVVRSVWAVAAVASPAWIVPVKVPGPPPLQGAGNAVHALPGLTPRSPSTEVGPVLATVEPARTRKPFALARPTGGSMIPVPSTPLRSERLCSSLLSSLQQPARETASRNVRAPARTSWPLYFRICVSYFLSTRSCSSRLGRGNFATFLPQASVRRESGQFGFNCQESPDTWEAFGRRADQLVRSNVIVHPTSSSL